MRPTSTSSKASKPLPKWLQVRIAASALVRGRLGTGNVIMLPFNKVVKLNVPANEIAALEYVGAKTTIPVPKILEIHDHQPDGTATIVMTQLPGTYLPLALRQMNSAQVASAVHELAGYLGQLRQFTPPSPPTIGSAASGSPGFDHRLGPNTWGPFRTVSDFHTYVRFGQPLEDWSHQPAVMEVHGKSDNMYKLRFSHADLAPHNILADPKTGKITGIIDWEFGGWYPEYWEYTKMYYGGVRPGWEQWFTTIEKEEGIEKYNVERRAEEVIWIRAGPFGYVEMGNDGSVS